MSRNQRRWGNNSQQEARVSNPFGAPQAQASSFSSGNPFQQQQRVPATFSNQMSNSSTSKSQSNARVEHGMAMMGDDIDHGAVTQQRVTNPFASFSSGNQPSQSMSTDDAVRSYKNDVRSKRGYPFSCLGPPDVVPALGGDISPAELRWYLSQGDLNIQKMISERASLMNEDYSDFLRGACGEGVELKIQRVGPYRVPDGAFPSFVPRGAFRVTEQSATSEEPAYEEWRKFISEPSSSALRIPHTVPPLEFR